MRGGGKMKIGRVERNPEISLKAQLAELRGKYAGFLYMYCMRNAKHISEIVFMYEEEKNND